MTRIVRFFAGITRSPLLCAGLWLMASPGFANDPLPTDSGQWWQYRGNQQISGRSKIKGRIDKPTICWSHPLAGRETLVDAAFAKGMDSAPLPTTDVATSPEGAGWWQIMQSWNVAGPTGLAWFDFDDKGQFVTWSRSPHQKIGRILPQVPGLQLIETEPKGYPKVPGVYKGTVRLKVRNNGQWVTRWETETPTLIWSAEPIFGDFDGDGQNEIALLPWFRLTLLDASTGKIKEQCNFLAENESEIPGHGGRAYGWFGATDVDGDGQPEFVIVEDFIRYATVIGRRNGKLQRLWLKVWEPKYQRGEFPDPETSVIVRVNPEPVVDVDGDGRKEIVVSIFNLTRDNRWHVLVLDALTGATKADLPGQFLTGLRDANGDGLVDLFCTAAEHGPRVPEPADLSILTLKGGKPTRLWSLPGAAFVKYDMGHFPPSVNSGAAMGGETVLCGPATPHGANVFFTRKVIEAATDQREVTCWQADRQGQFSPIAAWVGPRLEPLMVRSAPAGAASVLLQAAAFDGEPAEIRCPGSKAKSRVLVSQRSPAPVSPVVVGRPAPGTSPIVVAQGANESVEAFRLMAEGKTKRLWRVPGRGMTCNNYFEGVLLADLNGDGRLAAVVGRRGPHDCARLAVLNASDGKQVWTHDFEDFPGAPPPWNVPGLMYWQAGHFRDRRRMDLLVQMRRIGGESYLLDGRTGETIWRQSKGRSGRDFGRAWMAIADFDGDGLDDILNIYPDMFCIARGRDGKLLVAEESHKYVDVYAYYADMLVADFLNKGAPQVLYAHEFVTSLLTAKGERIWKVDHPHPIGWRNQAAWGDVDGDGRFEFLFPSAMGEKGREFQCRDAATGTLKWRFPMPDQTSTFPAVADIDGDGRDECVFTMGNTIYAVGAARGSPASTPAGAILWKLDLPGTAGPVAIAHVDGNGVAQIIVGCGDGRVYGIGPASSLPSRR